MRVYLCPHLEAGRPPVPASCVWCWMALYDPVRRPHWLKTLDLPGVPPGDPPPRPGPTPRPVPLNLLPVCRWQGAEVGACRTCGGDWSVIRYCDHPDDESGDYDRCTRGRNNGRDPLVRSCLTCDGYQLELDPVADPVRGGQVNGGDARGLGPVGPGGEVADRVADPPEVVAGPHRDGAQLEGPGAVDVADPHVNPR